MWDTDYDSEPAFSDAESSSPPVSAHSDGMDSKAKLNSSPFDSAESGLGEDKLETEAVPQAMLDTTVISQHPRYTVLQVGEPQKVSDGSSAYVSYLVTSQEHEDDRVEKVRRRFSEFVALHDALVREYPTCVIPPIPDKSRLEYIAGDRFSPEFTLRRAVALTRFLFRVSQHDELRRARVFAQFLHPGSGTSVSVPPADAPYPSALDHLGDTLMNAFVKARHQTKEMIDARDRAERYEQNIGGIDRAVQRVSRTQAELSADFGSTARFARKLAEIEPGSETEFAALGNATAALAVAAGDLRRAVDHNFGGSLHDMAHYVQALKLMLRRREQRQIDYEVLVEYLKRAEHELVAVEHGSESSSFSSSFIKSKINELRGVNKEQAREQRMAKLRQRIEGLRSESAYAKQLSDELEVLAKREVRVFEQTEAIELHQTLSGLTDSYIAYYRDVLQQCRELEQSLER